MKWIPGIDPKDYGVMHAMEELERKVERRHVVNLVCQFLFALLAALVALIAAKMLPFFGT